MNRSDAKPRRAGKPMAAGEAPDILNYTNYRQYLVDFHAAKQAADAKYSVRRFAREAGFSSHTFLRYLMEGKRNLSKKTLRPLCGVLGLAGARADYFENLVFFNQSEKREEKNFYYQKLIQSDHAAGLKKLAVEQFEVFRKWQHIAIREMLSLRDFNGQPEWIAHRLLPNIDPKEARESLQLLQAAGLIRRLANGYRVVDEAITTDDEVMALFIKNYHVQMMTLAAESMDRVDPEKRDISSVSFAIRESEFPKLKKQIQLMRKELRNFAAKDQEGERVVQVNIQLFPLSGEA